MGMNITSYVKKYGNESFDERPFSNVDALIMAQMGYLNWEILEKYNRHPINVKNIPDSVNVALNANEFDSCKDLCENIKSHVDEFQNDREQFDDITMLSFQYKGLNKDRIMEEATTSMEDISKFVKFAENVLNELNAPMKDIIKINIAIDEIVSNIFKYGYDNKPGYVKMKIRPSVDLKYVSISFYDRGVPYNPIKAEDPDVTMRLEDRAIGGLGIYVVKKTMDNMKYKYENGQNILTIKKIFTKE